MYSRAEKNKYQALLQNIPPNPGVNDVIADKKRRY